MKSYTIEVTEDAQVDLSYYTTFERKTIVVDIRALLTHQPATETRNRKKLRDNPISTWELRIGRYRVFYEVDETNLTVTIVAVGHKIHNILFIKGKELKL
jgi:mRNA-degrading endonuclease RelE of RelBE toxin-antitoxin system